MKFLLVLIVVMVGVWIWRSNRADARAEQAQQAARERQRARPGGAGESVAMLRCDHCGVHVPQGEALAGARGVYCSPEHRQQAEH